MLLITRMNNVKRNKRNRKKSEESPSSKDVKQSPAKTPERTRNPPSSNKRDILSPKELKSVSGLTMSDTDLRRAFRKIREIEDNN